MMESTTTWVSAFACIDPPREKSWWIKDMRHYCKARLLHRGYSGQIYVIKSGLRFKGHTLYDLVHASESEYSLQLDVAIVSLCSLRPYTQWSATGLRKRFCNERSCLIRLQYTRFLQLPSSLQHTCSILRGGLIRIEQCLIIVRKQLDDGLSGIAAALQNSRSLTGQSLWWYYPVASSRLSALKGDDLYVQTSEWENLSFAVLFQIVELIQRCLLDDHRRWQHLPLEHKSPVRLRMLVNRHDKSRSDWEFQTHLFDDSGSDKNVDVSRAKLFYATRCIAWCHFDAGRDFAFPSCDEISSHSIVFACCITIEVFG